MGIVRARHFVGQPLVINGACECNTVQWLPVQANLRLRLIGLVQRSELLGGHLALVLYSSNGPDERLQWLCTGRMTVP